MRKKIFSRTVLILVIGELVSILLFSYMQYRTNIENTKDELRNEANFVIAGLEINDEEFLNKVQRNEGDRISLIDNDGVVVYDSYVNINELDNHSSRAEVLEAIENGSGYSERYSNDMLEETIYFAVQLDSGYVVRISSNRASIWQIYMDMKYQLLAVIIITLAITALMAYRLSKSIVAPINRINLETTEKENPYPEIAPFTDKIAEQNRQIKKQIEELKSDVDEITNEADFRREFTANVSHELKTPLTSISGYAELIKEGIAKEEDIKPFAGKIFNEAQRLRFLVGDIIKLSQLDENSSLYKKEPVDIYALCEKTVSELQPLADKRGISINLKGNNVTVEGVEDILYEMIYNMCTNAIRYNVDNGDVDIEVALNSVRPYISIADTGIGIPEEAQARVFERFYMVDKSHSREVGGTGLGLSIVKHAALFHNAQINLESEENKGTKITVTF